MATSLAVRVGSFQIRPAIRERVDGSELMDGQRTERVAAGDCADERARPLHGLDGWVAVGWPHSCDTPEGWSGFAECSTGWDEALALLRFYVEHDLRY